MSRERLINRRQPTPSTFLRCPSRSTSPTTTRDSSRSRSRSGFEALLLTELENKSAGVLVGRLRSLGYDPALAARLDAGISERNRFVHHLFEGQEMMRALGGANPADLSARVEELVGGEIAMSVARLWAEDADAGQKGLIARLLKVVQAEPLDLRTRRSVAY